jgi:hypothetical protein
LIPTEPGSMPASPMIKASTPAPGARHSRRSGRSSGCGPTWPQRPNGSGWSDSPSRHVDQSTGQPGTHDRQAHHLSLHSGRPHHIDAGRG